MFKFENTQDIILLELKEYTRKWKIIACKNISIQVAVVSAVAFISMVSC